jgi:hypothetical protein
MTATGHRDRESQALAAAVEPVRLKAASALLDEMLLPPVHRGGRWNDDAR